MSEIPAEYKAMIDAAAGRDHSANGAVMRTLADILTQHEGRARAQIDSDRAFRLEALRVVTGGQPVRSAQAASVVLVIADHFADFVLHGTLPEFERDEPQVAKAPTGDWWWTRHGHPVDGVTPLGAAWAGSVSRCGGPGLCMQCSDDARRMRAGLPPVDGSTAQAFPQQG